MSADVGVRAPTVVLITDPRWPLAHVERTIEAAASTLAPGALVVQLRDKSASPDALAAAARSLRAVTSRVGALLVVNAPTHAAVRVALEAGADGAHVPCDLEAVAHARDALGASAWISTPSHSDDDVRTAAFATATAVLVSPIWNSPGKGPARGVAALRTARALARDVVVYALGGVDAANAPACAEAGANGVAVIRALLDAPDPATVACRLQAPFQASPVRTPRP